VIVMTAEGEALVGGMVNAGAVLRRGALVERPAPRNARALHAYLLALKEHGFDAAPVPVGLTEDGCEQLTFIPGDVALPPFPDWVMTKTALESVGSLLRRLHEASVAVEVDTRARWPRDLADPEGGARWARDRPFSPSTSWFTATVDLRWQQWGGWQATELQMSDGPEPRSSR
jgi:hypothetical protein